MDSFWVHRNFTWAQLQQISQEKGLKYPQISDLSPSLYVGAALALVQILTQKFVILKVGVAFGLATPRIGTGTSIGSTKILNKFSESLWKLLCYTFLVIFGAYTLLRKSWVWSSPLLFKEYPFQTIDLDVKLYYIAELSLYISMLITHFSGPKRKDFWMMVIHHIATMALLLLSWGINGVRVGSAIALCHDCADVPLELAKVGIYLNVKPLQDHGWTVFALVWLITRLGIFPFYLIWTCLCHYDQDPNVSLAFCTCLVLLVLILALNLIWTYFILKVAVRTLIYQEEVQDTRSSDEDEENDNNRAKNR